MDQDQQHTIDNIHQPVFSAMEPDRTSLMDRFRFHPVLFAFTALVVVFVLYQLIGGSLTVLIFGMKITKQNLTGIRIATMVGQIVFVLTPTLFLARLQSKKMGDALRLHPVRPVEIILALLGVFSLQGALQSYIYVQEKIPVPEQVKPFVDEIRRMIEETYKQLMSTSTVSEFLFVIVIVALTPAICEEILFRGLVQRNLEKGLKPTRGIILCGIIFGAYHFNPFMIVPLVVLGLYFGFLVYRTNSIYVSIAAHFFNNFIAGLSVYLIGDEDLIIPIPPGGTGGISVELIVSDFLLSSGLFLAILYIFIKVTAKRAVQDVQSIKGG